MDEYFCPNCGATLNDQYGFDPSDGSWMCTSCGMHLMDDDVYEGDTYEGVAWYCDDCGALLNRQPGFTDSGSSWVCTQCGHVNGTTEDDIINDGPQCPNCDSYLKSQSYYGGYEDDWTCEECGAKLHRDYSCDPYEVVREDEGPQCPKCGALLKNQYAFSDWSNDYTCSDCGAKLHRDYSSDPFEEVVEDNGPVCPRCGDRLDRQSYYNKYEDDWTCEECGAKLHHNYSSDPYEEVCSEDDDDDDYEDDDDVDDVRDRYTPQGSDYHRSSTESTGKSIDGQSEIKSVSEEDLRKIRIKAFLFKRKKVPTGYSYTDLVHKNYHYVRRCLKNQAFKNIKCVPIKDIHAGSPYSVGEVEQIVIDGSQYFNSDDMIPYDAEIVITYHEKKEIAIPFNSRYCRKRNYSEICDQLQELGFAEIYAEPIRDLKIGWMVKNGSIEKITIGGNDSFKKNAMFVYDTKIVIEYHTFKK